MKILNMPNSFCKYHTKSNAIFVKTKVHRLVAAGRAMPFQSKAFQAVKRSAKGGSKVTRLHIFTDS